MAYLLVSSVFLQDKMVLQILQFGLVDLQQTVQIGQRLLLFGQFDVLHQVETGPPCIKGFRVENLDTVNLRFGFIVLSGFIGLPGQLQFLVGFFLHVFAGGQEAAESR